MADDKEKKEKQIPRGKDLASLAAAFNKYLGADNARIGTDLGDKVDCTYLYPTGILSMDKYFGIGGLLGGRIMNAWGWEGCFAGDTRILDADTGITIAIKDLVDGKDELFNVPSTKCYSDDRGHAMIEPRPVALKYDTGAKHCLRMKTKHGASITVTPDHPFLALELGWTNLEDIKVGDYIARPKTFSMPGCSGYTVEFMKLVGYLIGDGCLTGESVRFAAYSDEVLNDVRNLVAKLYPDLSVKQCATEKRTYSISMNNSTRKGSNKLLNDLRDIGLFGTKNDTKHVPYRLMQSNQLEVEYLLAGLLMSDGHVARDKARVQYATVSEKLAEQVKFLLHRIGVVSSIQVRHDKRKPTYKTLYTVNIDSVLNLEPLRYLPLVGRRKSRLEKHLAKRARRSVYSANPSPDCKWDPVDIWWDRVESIEDVGVQQTYNVSVLDTESLVANDIITHNTGKTLTALTIGAYIQRSKFIPCPGNADGEGRVAFLDAEGTYSPSMAKSVGIDTSKLLLFQSTPEKILSGEDYFDIMKILIQNGVEFIIVDSLPALVPSSRMNATVGQGQKATSAVLIAEGLQQITPLLNGFKRSVVWMINQKRMKPMVMFGPTEGHTGGEAIKFFESYSLEVKKKGDIIKSVPSPNGQFENRRIGVTVEGKLQKNKTASIPVDPIQWDVYFETVVDDQGQQYYAGVDVYKDVVQTAIKLGIVNKSSSWYSYGDLKGNGEQQFIDALRASDRSILEKIRSDVLGRSGT